MRKRIALLLAILAVGGAATFVTMTLIPATSNRGVAVQNTPLPFVPAPYAPTAGPTMTPVPAPSDTTTLISAADARKVFDIILPAYGEVDEASVSLTRGQLADYSSDVSWLAQDYPVWVLSARGSFHPRSFPRGAVVPTFNSIVILIDAVTGRIIGVQGTHSA